MNTFTILRSGHYSSLNKYLFQKSVNQYIKYYARLWTTANRYQKNSVSTKEWSAKKEALKIRISDVKQDTKKKINNIIGKENIWTVPNLLCVGRILTTPYLSYLVLSEEYHIALWLFGLVGITDLADGWIARTWISQASRLGSFLDPVADKLLVGTLFLSLTWMKLIPISLTCIVIVRDVCLIAAASYIRYHTLTPPKTLAKYFNPTFSTVQLTPTFASKINTAVQLCLIAATVAAPVLQLTDHLFLQVLYYTTALTTLTSAFSYLTKESYKLLSKKKS